jgi:hypothetical protein
LCTIALILKKRDAAPIKGVRIEHPMRGVKEARISLPGFSWQSAGLYQGKRVDDGK